MESQKKQIATGILSSVYEISATAAVPLVAAGLALSGRGRRRYGERFGSWGELPALQWWMHGASVGEVQGLLPFVSELRSQRQDQKILLTSTSPTGLDRGGEAFNYRRLLPLDVGFCVRRALASVVADRFVLAETELWPTLLRELAIRGVPCHIINGRISDYTLRRYRLLRGLFAPILQNFRTVCVANDVQRERYLELGVRPDTIHVTGHTKYDCEPRVTGEVARAELRASFFPGESQTTPIVVLGSLRPGEEDEWFSAIATLQSQGNKLKVIIAPRHMEKVDHFIRKLDSSGCAWARWSDQRTDSFGRHDILLLDTMGKLEEAYSVAQLAFIGATLVDIGGHNPLEAAMYGVPVVVGPHISVIRELVEDMRGVGGIVEVENSTGLSADLSAVLSGLLMRVVARDPVLAELGLQGQRVWLKHRGAARRVVSVIAHGE